MPISEGSQHAEGGEAHIAQSQSHLARWYWYWSQNLNSEPQHTSAAWGLNAAVKTGTVAVLTMKEHSAILPDGCHMNTSVILPAHRCCGTEVPGWAELADYSGSLLGAVPGTMPFGWILPGWTVMQACDGLPPIQISHYGQRKGI